MSFKLATSTWDEKELKAIDRVVKSNNYTMGKEVFEAEKSFAKWNGSKYSIMVNSGSSANLLMVGALFYSKNSLINLKKGDEVIVPAVSWSTTYYPLQQYGMHLKFVDIDKETLNYDVELLKDAISENTKLIMCVNLLGNPNSFEEIQNLAKDNNIIFIEDNCESLGAKYNNKKTGTFGLVGSYSSYFSHHISSMEGGFVNTDNEEIYHIMLSLRSHGWTRHLPQNNLVSGEKSSNEFEESFKFVLPGYNLRPIEFMGAIASEQIKKLDAIISGRRNNADKFMNIISQYPFFNFQKEIHDSSWFGFSLICSNSLENKREAVLKIFSEEGIDVRPIVGGNFTKNKVMQYMDFSIHNNLKNSDNLDTNGFFIGNHHYDMTKELSTLNRALERCKHL